LLSSFEPPALFDDDLLAHVPGSRRARYLFIGGPRSGTYLHVDPLCTAAWNACTGGMKRWCFLPPHTDLHALGLAHFVQGRRQSHSKWFSSVYPRLRAAADRGELRMLECIQRRGDVVYVPAGWHHTVINLELSVAFSQNFISAAALPSLWPELQRNHAAFAATLRDLLTHARPDVAAALTPHARQDGGDPTDVAVPSPSSAHAPPSTADVSSSPLATALPVPPYAAPPAAAATPVPPLPAASDFEGADLPLLWRRAPAAAFGPRPGCTLLERQSGTAAPVGRSLLFVEEAWLAHLVKSRPSAVSIVAAGSAAPLLAYHTQLAALAALSRARGARLTLLRDARGGECETRALQEALLEHGMRFDAEMSSDEWSVRTSTSVLEAERYSGEPQPSSSSASGEQDWCTWAVLRADRRLATASAALALLPMPPLVCAQPRADAGAGIGLVCSRGVSAGEVLLELPLELCALAPPGADGEEAEAVLRDQLLGCGRATQPACVDRGVRPLRDYFKAMAPLERIAVSDIGCWAAFSPEAAARASGAIALQRANVWYAGAMHARERSPYPVDGAAGCEGGGSAHCAGAAPAEDCLVDEWLWASLVARRCCRVVRDVGAEASGGEEDDEESCSRRMLCPVADLAAHDSMAPNAALELHPSGCACSGCAGKGHAGGCVRLVARFAIAAGDSVSITYDPEADFVDLFEQHGMFDPTSNVHTAEVVPRGGLADALRPFAAGGGADGLPKESGAGAAADSVWRARLIASLAAIGCDAPTGAWWVPDHQPLACPLLGAFRATLASRAEMDAMRRASPDEPPHALLLMQPIEREAEARSLFGSVIRQHLSGFSTSLEQDLADADAGARLGGEAAAAALRFVTFEKLLLHDVLRAL
jgi:hypothetical protein